MTKILMVCMGNICRSPMAEAVARKLAEDAGLSKHVAFESAGTHTNHSGEFPDPRAEAVLKLHGYRLGRGQSRRVASSDFQRFDLILCMDMSNLSELRRICPSENAHKLALFLRFAEGIDETEVPDPYYGNTQGFERVLDLCEVGATGLIKHLK